MSEWQPIETAPKNGTLVLIAGGVFYCGDRPEYEFEGVAIALYKARDDGYWRGDEFQGDTLMHKPTHWMPLPEPPK